MITYLAVDKTLLNEAQQLGKHKTQQETINTALREYINHKKQQQILKLFHKIEYDKNYNYKKDR